MSSERRSSKRARPGCLLPWLAAMLLIGSIPYLALYTGLMPGLEILDEAGIDVESPVGAVTAGAALLVALATLVWCFGGAWRRRGR